MKNEDPENVSFPGVEAPCVTFHKTNKNIILVNCDHFFGTLEQFEEKIKNTTFEKEYIEYIKIAKKQLG